MWAIWVAYATSACSPKMSNVKVPPCLKMSNVAENEQCHCSLAWKWAMWLKMSNGGFCVLYGETEDIHPSLGIHSVLSEYIVQTRVATSIRIRVAAGSPVNLCTCSTLSALIPLVARNGWFVSAIVIRVRLYLIRSLCILYVSVLVTYV